MIFKLQYNWLKDFVDVPKDPREVARELTLYGASVERVQHVRHDWSDVIVAVITKIIPHPNADKLQLATVNMGGGKERVIVCGAPNIAVGQKVPLALPGAVLPGNFKIEKREVRGIESDGMLCSARELGIHDDHLGILVLESSAKVGTELMSLGAAEDYLLEVEPTTNRPDLQSVLGIAREVSAIMKKKLKTKKSFVFPRGKSSLNVKVEAKDLCKRFAVVEITGLQVGSSPWWLQERLARSGIRPINAVVDVTNYVMLELGQPLHAFDKEKLGNTLVVRRAKKGESLQALDGKRYSLTPDHLVVADAVKPVAIAGVMGGERTGVTTATTAIVLECANFDGVNIRRTSRGLKLLSDASMLFEKGLSEEAPGYATARATELILEICGGTASPLVDVRTKAYRPAVISFSLKEIPRLLGVTLPAKIVREKLESLGFRVAGSATTLKVTVPFWRDHDVAASEDLVEEVARLYGYHNFESVLPPARLELASLDRTFRRRNAVRDMLRILGYTETMSYSLVGETAMKVMGSDMRLKVSNPLSSDLQYMRSSLIPSLVQVVEKNMAERETLGLFEVGRVYRPGDKDAKAEIDRYRQEEERVGLVFSATGYEETQLRLVKGSLEALGEKFGKKIRCQVATEPRPGFSQGATADILIDGQLIGTVGVLTKSLTKAFGVERFVVAAEFSLAPFVSADAAPSFQPLPKFPPAKRDVSLVAPRDLRYSELEERVMGASSLLQAIELFDIYRGTPLAETEQGLSLHLVFRHADRTLTSEEVDEAQKQIVASLTTLNIRLRT